MDYTLQNIADKACQELLEKGQHMPYIIVTGIIRSGREGVAVLPLVGLPEDKNERNQMLAIGAMVMRKESGIRPDHIFHISEAWVSIQPLDAPKFDVQPKDDPNRKEILLVVDYVVATQETHALTYEMLRDGKGALIEIKAMSKKETVTKSKDSIVSAFLTGLNI